MNPSYSIPRMSLRYLPNVLVADNCYLCSLRFTGLPSSSYLLVVLTPRSSPLYVQFVQSLAQLFSSPSHRPEPFFSPSVLPMLSNNQPVCSISITEPSPPESTPASDTVTMPSDSHCRINGTHPANIKCPDANPVQPTSTLNVVITGGSAGIGQAIVTTFAQAGHRVLFTYLTNRENTQKLLSRWPNVTAAPLDQADVSSIIDFVSVVTDWAAPSGVHVLINNAALGSATVSQYVQRRTDNDSLSKLANGQMSESANKVIKRARNDLALMRVNALGPLWITEALSDLLHKAERECSRASIIFIGSVGGGSSAVFPDYGAADLMSKAAVTYLSKHLAAQHVRDNIDVICVAPGATDTEMFRESTLSKISDVPAFISGMPKRRLIRPLDVAKSVFWLAVESPAGLFHGAVLDASMGLAIRPGLQTENRPP